MAMYSGLRLDLKLKSETPPQIIVWLSKHAMHEGNIPEINSFFSYGVTYFPDWKGGSLKRIDEGDGYWHLKSNGVSSGYDDTKIAFFLHEIQPWLILEEGQILASIIYEEREAVERIFWIDPKDTLVRRRRATVYCYEDDHPRDWNALELAEPLGFESAANRPNWLDEEIFNFACNAVVSPAQEEKRILAKQHNEKYAAGSVEAIQEELKALEGKQ
ncbi:hypothetical protein MZD04_gp326 [Pseudomonas phage Psa21]|uniref:Uncharacterized protein n=1 Tax=Pseudomonas phage Psa21 TaxID=2530023 RepID=A0A481W575_9CAUD|nr:hypothetical protein MZD04_gp326 [Pseudomonas phage Psa21]QBJ02852.1 hypothetical protein PSA21_326 [Pseudomonas phage Psa21]